MIHVCHVVPRIQRGGPAGSILAEAAVGRGVRHSIVPLEPAASMEPVRRALRLGVRVRFADDADDLIRAADVVVLHYWNTPGVYAFLRRWGAVDLRWILHSRVNGNHPPQMLPAWLANAPNHLLLTSPHQVALRSDGAVSVVGGLVHAPDALTDRSGGAVHVGTLNVFKLDPAFVDLHRGVPITAVGSGGDEERLAKRAADLGVDLRLAGFLDDPLPLVATARVFSAPTSRFTYASSDKTIQEAAMVGVPAVVYRDSPLAQLVIDGVTGWLADDRDHFADLVRADHRLAPAAVADAARQLHSPTAKAAELARVYELVVEQAPRPVAEELPPLADWVAEQTRGARPNVPPLTELIERDDLLAGYQRWACEGGLAQFQASGPVGRP